MLLITLSSSYHFARNVLSSAERFVTICHVRHIVTSPERWRNKKKQYNGYMCKMAKKYNIVKVFSEQILRSVRIKSLGFKRGKDAAPGAEAAGRGREEVGEGGGMGKRAERAREEDGKEGKKNWYEREIRENEGEVKKEKENAQKQKDRKKQQQREADGRKRTRDGEGEGEGEGRGRERVPASGEGGGGATRPTEKNVVTLRTY